MKNSKEKKTYHIESIFTHANHKCVVTLSYMGFRCGYVGVDKSSPLFEIDYQTDLKKPELLKELKQTTFGKRGVIPFFCWDDKTVSPEILFNVHGGITYSDKGIYPITTKEQIWWFGFDCGHCDDAKDWKSVEAVFPESLYKTCKQFDDRFSFSGEIRSHNYVRQECKNLAEQISCVESTY